MASAAKKTGRAGAQAARSAPAGAQQTQADAKGVYNSMQRTALRAAADAERVCRAWHEAREVEVLRPGCRRAEG
jgi:hypothetical protein